MGWDLHIKKVARREFWQGREREREGIIFRGDGLILNIDSWCKRRKPQASREALSTHRTYYPMKPLFLFHLFSFSKICGCSTVTSPISHLSLPLPLGRVCVYALTKPNSFQYGSNVMNISLGKSHPFTVSYLKLIERCNLDWMDQFEHVRPELRNY